MSVCVCVCVFVRRDVCERENLYGREADCVCVRMCER